MQSKCSAIGILAAVLLLAGLVQPVYAGGVDPITIGISDGATNVGDTVEILVSLDAGNTAPSTLILFIKYDPARVEPVGDVFEFTFEDGNGDPVLDSDGNTVTFRSIVRTESSLLGLNKALSTVVHEQGILGIAIQGGDSEIPDGPLFTATFRVREGTTPGAFLALNGLDEDEGEFIDGAGPFSASAARSEDDGEGGVQTQPIGVLNADGTIEVNCVPVAEQPKNVTASQGRADAVAVAWDAVATPGAEYRVFRSNDQSLANALPLGSAWQTATVFNDITALVPESGAPGCACNAEPDFSEHYYWVRARTPQGCEGNFSSPPVLGYRGAAKAANAKATAQVDVFPAATAAGGVVALATNAQAALRVEGALPTDAALFATSAATTAVLPANDDGTSWWITATPAPVWADGETIVLRANGVVRSFVVDAAIATTDKRSTALQVDFAPEGAAPWLPEGVGKPYSVGPEGVFTTPQTLWLPVPTGSEPEDLIVYAWHASGGDRGWYYASQIAGLTTGGLQYRETPLGNEIGVTLRHSAILQLGEAVRADAPVAASVVPLSFGQLFEKSGGGLLILAASVMILCLARFSKPATH